MIRQDILSLSRAESNCDWFHLLSFISLRVIIIIIIIDNYSHATNFGQGMYNIDVGCFTIPATEAGNKKIDDIKTYLLLSNAIFIIFQFGGKEEIIVKENLTMMMMMLMMMLAPVKQAKNMTHENVFHFYRLSDFSFL